jgi:hypothetical protein
MLLVNSSIVRPNFLSSFGLDPIPDLPSVDWIRNALTAHPHIAAREAVFLTNFTPMEKLLIIRNLFLPIVNHSHLILTIPDLIFPLLSTQNDDLRREFLVTTGPEWSFRRNFIPFILPPEDELVTSFPDELFHSRPGSLLLTDPARPLTIYPGVATMPLPSPLNHFFSHTDNDVLQFLGLQQDPKLFDAKAFLSFLQLDPTLLLGGCYTAIKSPSHRNLALTYREAFLLYLSGYPDFPSSAFQHPPPDIADDDESEYSEFTDSSNSPDSPDLFSDSDWITLVDLVPTRKPTRP